MMPKRPRSPSFEESPISLQCKTHISERMFYKTAYGQEQISAVYEKTLGILYRGSKNVPTVEEESVDVCDGKMQVQESIVPSDQMRLTSNLQLLKCDTNMEVSSHYSIGRFHEDSDKSYNACMNCRVLSSSPFGRCGYCEKNMCGKCLQPCIQCGFEFCAPCSLPVYRFDEERICTSCSTRPTSQLGFYP
ncbi:apoptosis regulatory protein Siva-like isoform X2 [Artemia franciscana]